MLVSRHPICLVDACVTGNPDPPAPTEPSVPGSIDPTPTPAPSSLAVISAMVGQERFAPQVNQDSNESPAVQQCENNAASKYNATIGNLTLSFWSSAHTNAKVGALAGLPIGCVYGAVGAAVTIVGAPAAPIACAAGALGMSIDGFFGGIAITAVVSSYQAIEAQAQYNLDMQACAAQ